MGASAIFTSCNINETPVFDDKDSFVAFSSTALSFDENSGRISVALSLAAVHRKSTTVSFDIIEYDGQAEEGVNYRLVGENKVQFTTENSVQYIQFDIINIPGVFTGDLYFDLAIKDGGSVDVGNNKTCRIRILDLDHPQSIILGAYSASGNSYFYGWRPFTVTILKDDGGDLNKVWFENFFDASLLNIYGIVNPEQTEIKIPVGQVTRVDYSKLKGYFTDEDDWVGPTDDMPDGQNLIMYIEDGGKKLWIPSKYEFGANVTGTNSWHNIFVPEDYDVFDDAMYILLK